MPICGRCGRKLKTPDAINAGYGKVCYQKLFGKPFPTSHKPRKKSIKTNSDGRSPKKSNNADAIPLFASDVICSRGTNGEVITNIPQRIVYHSPDGFEWGYCGSGPADFALNILSLYIGEQEARQDGLYQRFKEDFIAKLPQEGGTIKREDILAWISNMDKKERLSKRQGTPYNNHIVSLK